MADPTFTERVAIVSGRGTGRGPAADLRRAVVRELEDWRAGLVVAPVNLLIAVEEFDSSIASSRWAGFSEAERLAIAQALGNDRAGVDGVDMDALAEEANPRG